MNHLPVKCLAQILLKASTALPFRKALKLRSVCSLWHQLVDGLIAFRIKSVQLFGSLSDLQTFENTLSLNFSPVEHNTNKEEHLILIIDMSVLKQSQFCEFFSRLFSKIQSLLIYLQPEISFYELPYLIKMLPSLVTLSLHGSINPYLQYGRFSILLCDVIDTDLPKLRHLHLQVRGLHRYSDFKKCVPPIPLDSILHLQLKSFSLVHFSGELSQVLPQVGPSLHQLSLGSKLFSEARASLPMIKNRYQAQWSPKLSIREIYEDY